MPDRHHHVDRASINLQMRRKRTLPARSRPRLYTFGHRPVLPQRPRNDRGRAFDLRFVNSRRGCSALHREGQRSNRAQRLRPDGLLDHWDRVARAGSRRRDTTSLMVALTRVDATLMCPNAALACRSSDKGATETLHGPATVSRFHSHSSRRRGASTSAPRLLIAQGSPLQANAPAAARGLQRCSH